LCRRRHVATCRQHFQLSWRDLTLFCLGTSLVRHLELPVHISSSNGLMDMIERCVGNVF
jgi:hypothetical protein